MSGEVLFEQPDNRGGLWRLQVSEHRGRTLVNWRRWWRQDGEGPWLPSKTGVSFRPEGLSELADALAAWQRGDPPAGNAKPD